MHCTRPGVCLRQEARKQHENTSFLILSQWVVERLTKLFQTPLNHSWARWHYWHYFWEIWLCVDSFPFNRCRWCANNPSKGVCHIYVFIARRSTDQNSRFSTWNRASVTRATEYFIDENTHVPLCSESRVSQKLSQKWVRFYNLAVTHGCVRLISKVKKTACDTSQSLSVIISSNINICS